MVETATVGKWNPYSRGYFKDPYPHLAECRENNPIQQCFEDSYFFFKYKHVHALLKQRDLDVISLSDYLSAKEDYIFQGDQNACPYLGKATQSWPMYLNGSTHREVRTAITRAFHAIPFAQIINDSLDKTFHQFESLKKFDLVEFCGTFIHHFITEALQMQDREPGRIRKFSNLLAVSQDLYVPKQTYRAINDAALESKSIFAPSQFKDVLLENLSEDLRGTESLYSILLLTFMASFETSKDNLSLALSEILKNGSSMDYIATATNDELKKAIEETFRYSSPLQYTVRTSIEPMEIDGHAFPSNSKLYLCIASANRDEDEFTDAAEFKVDRSHNPHVAFGLGPHQCLGATIARKEMDICLQPMVNFLKDYQVEETKFARQIFMRTAKSIMVELR